LAELVEIIGQVGFRDVRVTQRFDSFAGTSKENVAKKFAVRGVNIFARREG
jgi:hypothetical protein